jgi:hypothetical protein
MFLFEGIAALAAKVASASTIAQATTGLGIAVAGVTGAGAAGVLPGPVQDGVANTVEAVTPFELPRSVDDRISGVDDRHETTRSDDSTLDGPAAVPTVFPAPPSVAAPTSAHEEHEAENADEDEDEDHGVEHTEDSTHQHRGGRPATGPAPTTSGSGTGRSGDDSVVPAPEVEDHHGDEDRSGHGGDHSGDDSGGGDHSGHGGGDD